MFHIQSPILSNRIFWYILIILHIPHFSFEGISAGIASPNAQALMIFAMRLDKKRNPVPSPRGQGTVNGSNAHRKWTFKQVPQKTDIKPMINAFALPKMMVFDVVSHELTFIEWTCPKRGHSQIQWVYRHFPSFSTLKIKQCPAGPALHWGSREDQQDQRSLQQSPLDRWKLLHLAALISVENDGKLGDYHG
jgi:hypothetical protein